MRKAIASEAPQGHAPRSAVGERPSGILAVLSKKKNANKRFFVNQTYEMKRLANKISTKKFYFEIRRNKKQIK